MLSPADEERERCESRRKAQLDYNTAMKVARMEGRAEGRREGLVEGRREGLVEGRREGLKIGTIHVAERMLHRPETPVAQLLTLSIDDLRRLADDLHEQVAATMKNLPEHR